MKKWMSTLLAIDFAIGFCTIGSNDTFKKAEKAVEPVKTAICDVAEQITPKKEKTANNPYLKQKLGTFYITFYVPDSKWGRQTATGETPVHLSTCAVDRSLIPYGSTLLVVGQNGQQLILRANDCGDFGGKQLDIFWDKPVKEGYSYFGDFGEYATVYILEE